MRLVALLLGGVNARVFMGIANPLFNNVDYERIGRFCFSIPPSSRGIVKSDVIVQDPGHRLVLTHHSDEFMFRNYSSFTPDVHPAPLSPEGIRKHLHAVWMYQHALGQIKPHRRQLEEQRVVHEVHPGEIRPEAAGEVHPNEAPGEVHPNQAPGEVHPNQAPGELHPVEVHQRPADPPATTNSQPASGSSSTVASIAEHDQTMTTLETPIAASPAKHNALLDLPVIIGENQGALGPHDSPKSMCEAINQHAVVTENLYPIGFKSLYSLTLLVDSGEHNKDVDIWVTRCGASPHAHYKISVMNPGGLFTRHFGCREQGVLQTALISVGLFGMGIVPLQKLLYQCAAARREHPVIDAYLLAGGAAGIHALCHAMHILAFAFDGMGVRALAFIGDLAHWAFITAVSFVVLRLVLNKRFAKSRALLDTSENRNNSGVLGEASVLRSYVNSMGIKGVIKDPMVVKRAAGSVVRLALSSIGLWVLLSSSAFCAMVLQGMKGLFAPDAIIVPDFEFLHPSSPQYGCTFLQYILIMVIRIHWAFRVILGYIVVRMLLLSRRLTIGRQVGAYATVGWCLVPPLNGILFQGFHHAHQFLIQLVVTCVNLGLLFSLGFLIIENPKYNGGQGSLVKRPLFRGDTNDGLTPKQISEDVAEDHAQLIDLTRMCSPTGDFNVMRRDAR